VNLYVVPFKARGYRGVAAQKLSGEIIPARELVPGLSLKVDWAIHRALGVSPHMRPASCSEFVRDLTGSDLVAEPPVRNAAPRAALEVVAAEPTGDERRGAIRYPCHLDSTCLPLGGQGQKPWAAAIRDISVNGLGLVLERRFEPGTVLVLQWQRPGEDVPRNLMARVVRTQSQESARWVLGCQLARSLGDEEVRALL
jgi:hypothetical protein